VLHKHKQGICHSRGSASQTYQASRQDSQQESSKKAEPTGGDDVADLDRQAQVQPILACVVPALQAERKQANKM
jgi:hypothetical protein